MNEQMLTPVKEKVWEHVYRKIRQNFCDNKYKPDEIISEIEIAKELRVSRTPVTMAINVLEQEGLIINHNGKKTIYRPTSEELVQYFDAKISLQCTTVRLAIERKTEGDEQEFRKVLEEIELFLKSDFSSFGINPELNRIWENLDTRFHNTISEMTKSPYLKKLIDDIDIKWTRIRTGVTAMGDRTQKNAEEHLILGEMILNNKVEEAEGYMTHHLQNILTTVLHLMTIF